MAPAVSSAIVGVMAPALAAALLCDMKHHEDASAMLDPLPPTHICRIIALMTNQEKRAKVLTQLPLTTPSVYANNCLQAGGGLTLTPPLP